MAINQNYTGELISELTNLELCLVSIQAKRDYTLKLVGIHAGILNLDPTVSLTEKERELVYKFIKDQREAHSHLAQMQRLNAANNLNSGNGKDAITLFGGREDRL